MPVLKMPENLETSEKNQKMSAYRNGRGNVHVTQNWGAFVLPLLQCKSNKHSIFWVCFCTLKYPAFAHLSYYIVIYGLCGSTLFSYIFSKASRFSDKAYWI